MEKRILILILLTTFTVNSQSNIIPLWDKIPNSRPTSEIEENAKKTHLFITKVNTPTLEVFMPDRKYANGKSVIICPGGGYFGVSYNSEGTTFAKWFNAIGVTAFVLKYRMPNSDGVKVSYEAPLQDAQRAIRMVRFNAEKYGVDKDKIGIMGFSAGGHLAATLGTHFNAKNNFSESEIDLVSAKPNFMILAYPVVTMKKDFTHMGSRNSLLGKNPTKGLIEDFSNELQVKEDTPTTFIMHCQDDKVVPVENSLQLYSALKAKNIPVTMHLYPKGGHGFGLGLNKGNVENWTDLLKYWIRYLE